MTTAEQTQLKVLFRGAPGLRDTLLAKSQGGAILDAGVSEIVAENHPDGPAIDVRFEPCAGIASFRRMLGDEATDQTEAFEYQPDIIVLSVESDLRASEGAWGPDEADRFQRDLTDVVHLVKEKLDSHIIILNASSVDPAVSTTSYHGLDHEPRELRAHRYNLAVMHVSFQEGVSVVDADRLVAELGATGAVEGFLEYRAPAATAISHELVRVIADYGFLDNRPLLPQVGRDAAT